MVEGVGQPRNQQIKNKLKKGKIKKVFWLILVKWFNRYWKVALKTNFGKSEVIGFVPTF